MFQQMEKKKQENKMRRDQLNDQYLELLEKQRLYFKTVKEFKEVRGGLGWHVRLGEICARPQMSLCKPEHCFVFPLV